MIVVINVAFPMVRVAFTLSDATRLSEAAREVARSRALVFSDDFVSKTVAGEAFFAIRFMDRREFTGRLACESNKNCRKSFVCNVSIEMGRRTSLIRRTPSAHGPKCLFWRNVALAYGESNVFEASTGACL